MAPRSFLLVLIVISCTFSSRAQESWYSEQFMSENGLLQNRVHDMVKDQWGALLIGTEGGLVRFDGHHFKQIGINSPGGMKPSRVLEIIPTMEGHHVVRDAGCRQYLYANDTIRSLTGEAPTRQYTSRFTGSMGSVRSTVKAMDPDSVLERKEDWPSVVRAVSLPDGLWCLRNASALFIYREMDFVRTISLPAGRSTHLFGVGDHAYLFDNLGDIYRIDPRTWTLVPVEKQGFPVPDIKNGQLAWRLFWNPQDRSTSIITGEGLYTLAEVSKGEGLLASRVDIQLPQGAKVGGLVWLDGNEALALGTDNKGLFIYRKQPMRSFLCEGLSEGVNNAYNAQAPFGRNGVITSTRNGTYSFDERGCSPQKPPLPKFNDAAVHLDIHGNYWYGRGDTLLRYDLAGEEETVVRAGLKPLCFLEEGEVLWVGAGTGVHRFEQGILSLAYPLTEGDLAFRPNDLCRTPDGQFWMATCSGVYRLGGNDAWEVVNGLGKVCARTLEVVDDAIMVGTYGTGAFLERKGRIWQFQQDERGFLSHVHAFMPDGQGFVWMSTNQGLFRMKLSDLFAWTADTTLHVYYAYYGKKAGLNNAEFNGGCSPPYVRTRSGWASFPTMDGLAWFLPESIPDAFPSQHIRVEGVSVSGSRVSGPIFLTWDHRDVRIELSLSYWGDLQNALIEYTLGDGDVGWSVLPAGQRELNISALPAGDHVLRIRKLGAMLRGDRTEVNIPIVVEPPLYRKAWFILSCLAGTAFLFVGGIQLNASRLRRRNAQLERKVNDRTRELSEANADLRRSLEMKEMLVSIISHDIVTPLRFIARVAGGVSKRALDDPDPRMASTLSDLANSSEKLHANAQGLLQWIKRQDGRIELRPRNIVVRLLVEEVLERERERATENGVVLHNSVALDDTIRADRNVLSIILHNAIGNAVTHSGGSSVSVSGEHVGEHYRITIKDKGGGMPEAVLSHAKRVQAQGALGAMGHEGEREVQGLGLLIIADLTQLMGGEFTVDSEVGIGTTVCITLPTDSEGRIA